MIMPCYAHNIGFQLEIFVTFDHYDVLWTSSLQNSLSNDTMNSRLKIRMEPVGDTIMLVGQGWGGTKKCIPVADSCNEWFVSYLDHRPHMLPTNSYFWNNCSLTINSLLTFLQHSDTEDAAGEYSHQFTVLIDFLWHWCMSVGHEMLASQGKKKFDIWCWVLVDQMRGRLWISVGCVRYLIRVIISHVQLMAGKHDTMLDIRHHPPEKLWLTVKKNETSRKIKRYIRSPVGILHYELLNWQNWPFII